MTPQKAKHYSKTTKIRRWNNVWRLPWWCWTYDYVRRLSTAVRHKILSSTVARQAVGTYIMSDGLSGSRRTYIKNFNPHARQPLFHFTRFTHPHKSPLPRWAPAAGAHPRHCSCPPCRHHTGPQTLAPAPASVVGSCPRPRSTPHPRHAGAATTVGARPISPSDKWAILFCSINM